MYVSHRRPAHLAEVVQRPVEGWTGSGSVYPERPAAFAWHSAPIGCLPGFTWHQPHGRAQPRVHFRGAEALYLKLGKEAPLGLVNLPTGGTCLVAQEAFDFGQDVRRTEARNALSMRDL